LEARNRELVTFDRTVAHDIKSPLGVIIGFAEVLERRCADMPREQLEAYLRKIAQHGRKLSDIVDRLLLLAGVCEMEVELAPLDMDAIVGEALERLAHTIEAYQAEIVLPDATAWPVALGYGPWVEEVWANYISNACKYGGRPPRVELGAVLPSVTPVGGEGKGGRHIRFWVRDNGRGLSPEDQARLFAPFTRLYQAQAQGHGLGLSIVQQIVQKLGGQVGIESSGVPGQGSAFSFTLPSAIG
jgi:signal transduction histidine kinase